MTGLPIRRSAVVVLLFLAGCLGNDPGPLKGTWQVSGLVPMTVTFRSGESEALGMIDKVSYKKAGTDVLVTYKTGISKGTTIRFTMTGPETAKSEFGTLRRIRK